MQPHLVGVNSEDPKAILLANVSALMRHRYGRENLTRLANDCKLGPGTASRIKAQETSVGIDVLAGGHLAAPASRPASAEN